MSVGERRGMGEVGAGAGLKVGCGQGNVPAHHGESKVAAHEGSAEWTKSTPTRQKFPEARSGSRGAESDCFIQHNNNDFKKTAERCLRT